MSEKAANVLAMILLCSWIVAGASIFFAVLNEMDIALYLVLLAIFGMKLVDFFKP